MKTIQLHNIKYKVPTSWSEVTLAQQLKVSEDAAKIIDNPTLQKISLLSGYCNIPLQVLKESPVDKIAPLFKHIGFINEPLPTKPITEFTFKGHKYTVAETMMKNQFQDWVSIETAFSMHKEDSYNAIPLVIAVLAKKEGETLDDFNLEERAEEFKQLPMTIVEPLKVFFSLIEVASSATIQLSLKENQEAILKGKLTELKSTLNRQVGGAWWQRLLRWTLRRWVKSLEPKLISSLTSTPSKFLKKN